MKLAGQPASPLFFVKSSTASNSTVHMSTGHDPNVYTYHSFGKSITQSSAKKELQKIKHTTG